MERLTKRDFNFTTNYVKRDIDAWSIAQCLKKLQEYEDLEEQGLLRRLPCKVGDWLYYVISYLNVVVPVRLNDVIVSFIGIDRYSCQYNCCCFDECGDVYEDFEFDTDDFGKTVFLTKEEAERELEKINNNG